MIIKHIHFEWMLKIKITSKYIIISSSCSHVIVKVNVIFFINKSFTAMNLYLLCTARFLRGPLYECRCTLSKGHMWSVTSGCECTMNRMGSCSPHLIQAELFYVYTKRLIVPGTCDPFYLKSYNLSKMNMYII